MVVFLSDLFITKVIKHKSFMFDYGKSKNKDSYGLFTLENFVISLVSNMDLGVDYQVYVKLSSNVNHDPELLDINYMFVHPLRWVDISDICINSIEDKDYINSYFNTSFSNIQSFIDKEDVNKGYYPVSVEVFLVENKWYFNSDWVRPLIGRWLESWYF